MVFRVFYKEESGSDEVGSGFDFEFFSGEVFDFFDEDFEFGFLK